MTKLFLFLLVLISFVKAEENDVFEKAVKDLASEQYEARLQAKKLLDEIGLKAIPYLRKVLDHEDLEVREYAEQRINKSLNYKFELYKPENYIGSTDKLVSFSKNMDDYYKFLNSFLWKLYEKNAKGEKWDAQMQKVISLMCDYLKFSEIDYEINDFYHAQRGFRRYEVELRKALQEVSALGCNDPMFLFLRQGAYFSFSDGRFSIDELVAANNQLKPEAYSQYFNYFTYVRQNAIRLRNGMSKTNVEYISGQNNILNAWIEIGKEDFIQTPIGQRRYYLWLVNFGEEMPIAEIDKEFQRITATLKSNTYISHMVRGWYYWKKALSFKVKDNNLSKPENLKNFLDNISLAEVEAKEAIKKNIDSPDAAILMISILSAKSNNENLRVWFERGLESETNNSRLFFVYYNAIIYQNINYYQTPLSLGREYLVANKPNLNLAKFFMIELRDTTRNDGLTRFDVSILDEVEWAVEQQIAYKPAYFLLYHNDMAYFSFLAGDIIKTHNAIQKSKNLFSMGWYDRKISSGVIERWSALANKYKDTSSGKIMLEVEKGSVKISNQKAQQLIGNVDKTISQNDLYQLLSMLLINDSFENLDQFDSLWRLLETGGYREVLMSLYLKSSVQTKSKYSELIKKHFSEKYIEARKLIMTFSSFSNDPQKELSEKIKTIYLADGLKESELEKNDDYLRCMFLSYFVLSDDNPNSRKYREVLLPLIKKFSNHGEAIEFLCTSMNNFRNKNLSPIFFELIMTYFFRPNDLNMTEVEDLISAQSAIKEDIEFKKNIKENWLKLGKPYILLQLIDLCKKRNLTEESEVIKAWFFYCAETLGRHNESEDLMMVYSAVDGYSKEAYQIGCKLIRYGSRNVVGYLQAYHLFKLGHHQMAYEYLVKAQTNKEQGAGATILDSKKFMTSDDLLMFIVKTMLDDKKLPENIRFNLLDQFSAKLKN